MIKVNEVYFDDNLNVLKNIPDNTIDSIITDPPYGLKFKGNKWDYSIPNVETFKELLRVIKPGGRMLIFGGTRTYHRMAVNIEDAGWWISDMISWVYGEGFPKSVDISYMIDKKINKCYGDIQQEMTVGNPMESDGISKEIKITKPYNELSEKWNGWGTALKPSWEPIIIASKPIEGNYEDNALKWDCVGMHIDACRIGEETFGIKRTNNGRWPTNIIFDDFTLNLLEQQVDGKSKFFYCAKPSKKERKDNKHPTVKPLKLIEYLCKLTETPNKGVVLDPYAGSGTTGIACIKTGRDYILIEKEKEYYDFIIERIKKETEN